MSLQDFPEQKVKAKLLYLLDETSKNKKDRIKKYNDRQEYIQGEDVQDVYHGKVRDVYLSKNYCLLVATDRISAFDYSLGEVPFKGRVLNRISQWWFRMLEKEHWARNEGLQSHVLRCKKSENSGRKISGETMLCQRTRPVLLEFVVRGYLTGSSPTSILTHYNRGARSYCGCQLSDGLVKHQRLPEVLVTPTTKGEHDELISGQEIVERGYLSQQEWEWCHRVVLKLFEWGSRISSQKGLILVDTKYEFGRDLETGKLILIDELHTPDSSRFWIASSYQERFTKGETPENINKEFLRVWIKENHPEWLVNGRMGVIPKNLLAETGVKYLLYAWIMLGQLLCQ